MIFLPHFSAITRLDLRKKKLEAKNSSADGLSARITPRHLQLAIKKDSEIDEVLGLGKTCITGGGVLPNIHPALKMERKEMAMQKQLFMAK